MLILIRKGFNRTLFCDGVYWDLDKRLHIQMTTRMVHF